MKPTTSDTDAALAIGDRVATGTWFMNRCDYLDPALAWVGIKDSGRGCTLSRLGIEAPLVADMSSSFMSRPLDVSRFGLIYAGAQKNVGPAGLCIVIVREDLVGTAMPGTPAMFDYRIHVDNDSMYNTPPTYAMYITGLVLEWLKKKGGLAEMEKINVAKASLLYDYLDTTGFYHCPVATADRSRMNIPFTLKDKALDDAFLKQARAHGLIQLKGHRSVGGMRASIYNAMPFEGVKPWWIS